MKRFFSLILFATLIFSFSTCFAVKKGGVKFPDIQRIGDTDVKIKGAGVFSPFGFSIYVLGLYSNNESKDNMVLKDLDEPMTLQLYSLYGGLKIKDLMKEIKRGFKYSTDRNKEVLAAIDSRVKEFLNILNSKGDPKKYGAITFSYEPGKGTHINYKEEYLGTIPGLDFKKAFFGIWLNHNCADNGLRSKMIGK